MNTKDYQVCVECGNRTGFCEEDALYDDDGYGPLCEDCYDNIVAGTV